MSILAEITNRIQEGRLQELLPALPSQRLVRRMIVSPDIAALVLGPWTEPDWEERCNYLRADLDRFISGQTIPVTAGKLNDRHSYLKQLIPAAGEIWEIRSRDPDPSLRVMGRFAAVDVFVALAWYKRASLGGPSSRPWRDATVQCATDWRNLFPAYEPIHADTSNGFNDYVSNCFPV